MWLFLTPPTDRDRLAFVIRKAGNVCSHDSFRGVTMDFIPGRVSCDWTSLCCQGGCYSCRELRTSRNPVYDRIQNSLGERSLEHGT